MLDNKVHELLMAEEHLVKGCVDNNVVSQKRLYDLYSKKMMGVCLRYSGNYDEAQDILQEGFIKVFKKINTFKGSGSLEGWIRKIIVNTALENHRRSNVLRLSTDIQDVEPFLETNENIIESLAAKELLNIIQRLPEGYRVIFNLYAVEGYSHKEIAEQLNISESTSKSQYSRARILLQKMIKTEFVI
ncbi:MAG: sigma-70 family RNA polymerase sigma factor [Bacteroidota bacterium]